MKVTIDLTQKQIKELKEDNHSHFERGNPDVDCCHCELCYGCYSALDKIREVLNKEKEK